MSILRTENDGRPLRRRFNPLVNPTNSRPVIVEDHPPDAGPIFLARPLLGALIFENSASDARDHLANERTFLSWLRLSIYLAIVSSAIVVSFHLRTAPTEIERRIALPLGIVLWCMSLACLASGFSIYVKTVTKYSRKAALVQSGWKTQVFYIIMATVIIGSCVLFLSTNAR
ncbi:hypothetical protein VTN77DRAFT_412 [Rasamsonia byssochlamydoides]|uniref:uncharacterized protein n=1 Tax=Rasamsonia byssochlamydoides TaxID=89139 RepID=UPI0037442D32